MKKILIGFIGVLAIGALVYSLYRTQGDPYEKTKSIDAVGIEQIEVENDSWNIEVKAAKSEKITVTAKGKQKNKETEPVTVEQQGDKLVVKQTKESGVLSGISIGKNGKVTIEIPENRLKTIVVKSSDGDIELEKIAADKFAFSNGSGNLKLKGVSVGEGNIDLKDGQVKLENSTFESLKSAAGSGDTTITNVQSPKMDINSTDGIVSIEDATEGELLNVQSKSGDITVSYKEAPVSLRLVANSNTSDLEVGLEHMKKTKETENTVKGKIGDGANQAKLTSKDGKVSVK